MVDIDSIDFPDKQAMYVPPPSLLRNEPIVNNTVQQQEIKTEVIEPIIKIEPLITRLSTRPSLSALVKNSIEFQVQLQIRAIASAPSIKRTNDLNRINTTPTNNTNKKSENELNNEFESSSKVCLISFFFRISIFK